MLATLLWSNNRQGAASIKERLDKGLASLSWTTFTLNSPSHYPISLNTAFFSLFLHKPFRFEELWTKDPSCSSVIETAWFKHALGSPAQCLISKLQLTRNSLQRWNHLHFGKIQSWIKSTLAKLDAIQKSPPSSSSFSLETSLKSSLDGLLLKEEILWKSKSKELWLFYFDLNTKFFHTSTIIKRRSNAVNFLKTDSSSWLSYRSSIGATFVSHFTNLFSSTNPPVSDEMLDLFTPVITKDDSLNLCSIPFKSEVFQALSSLGSSMALGPDGYTALFYKKILVSC